MTKPDKPHNGHGQGSYMLRPSGRIQAQVWIQGKRYTKTVKNITEGRRWVREMHGKADKNELPTDGGKQKLADYLAQWLQTVTPALSPSSQQAYARNIRLYLAPALGEMRLLDLRPDHLQSLYAQRLQAGAAANSVKQLHGVIHQALGDAVQWQLLGRNVAVAVRLPKVQKKPIKAWTPDQARAFLAGTEGDRRSALWHVAIYTGLRASELAGLKWEDVDLGSGRIQVQRNVHRVSGLGVIEGPTKTRAGTRGVVVPASVCEVLRQWRTAQKGERIKAGAEWIDSGHVFTTLQGKPIERALIYGQFVVRVKRLDLPRIPLHALRHTAASLLLSEGVPPKIVQEMLGHTTIAQTMDTYGHLFPNSQDQAAAAMGRVLQRPRE